MRLTLDLFGRRLDVTLDRLLDDCELDEDTDDEDDHPRGDVFTNTDRADPFMPTIGFGPNPREDS